MRAAILFLYPLVALAAPPLERRQLDVLGFGSKTETKKWFKKEITTSPLQQDGVKRLIIHYGPYRIRAANSTEKTESGTSMDPAGTAWTHIAGDFPSDITILQARTQIEFADGMRARAQTGVYNHHVVFVDVTKPLPEVARCTTRNGPTPNRMSIIMGNPEDSVPNRYIFPNKNLTTGYYLKKGNPVLMSADLVNYTNETKVVYTRAEVDFVEGKPSGLVDTSLQTFRLAECDREESYIAVEVPKGQNKFTLKSKEMKALGDGYIFSGRGHIHDGGLDVTVVVNGKESCTSEALYGIDEAMKGKGAGGEDWVTIKDMTVCPNPLRIRKGDSVIVQANYDFDKHPRRVMHDGGMGELMGTFSFNFAT